MSLIPSRYACSDCGGYGGFPGMSRLAAACTCPPRDPATDEQRALAMRLEGEARALRKTVRW